MKPKVKNYEILMAVIIIANIFIFMYFSKKLENLTVKITNEMETKNGL